MLLYKLTADTMDAKLNQARPALAWSQSKLPLSRWFSIVLLSIFGFLVGCEQQPKSMFEQQAEVDSADEITEDEEAVIPMQTISERSNDNISIKMQINKQQAIARQPNCEGDDCQYFELNVLEFTPKQPWLTSIMWQTIAQVLAPETPLASQDQTAKNTILMLIKQIEYGEQRVTTLPRYERIDSELVLHPIQDTHDSLEPIATGYLLVSSTTQRDNSQQTLDYVMLDMQKKLQLTIEDILLTNVSTDQLLIAFKGAKEQWLRAHGVQENDLADWPLTLSNQWYLDEQGLHLVYQSGQLVATSTDIVDLLVPYEQLQGLIKPSYIVKDLPS